MSRCLVLGGGVGSLSFAHYLKQKCPSATIRILEQQDQVGGWCKTFQHDNNTLTELGPRSIKIAKKPKLAKTNTFSAESANMKMLIHELGLRKSLLPAQSAKPCIYFPEKEATLGMQQFGEEKRKEFLGSGTQGLIFAVIKSYFNPIMHKMILRESAKMNKGYDMHEKTIKELVDEAFNEELLNALPEKIRSKLTDMQIYEILHQLASAFPRGIFAGDYSKICMDSLIFTYPDLVPNKEFRNEYNLTVTPKMLNEMMEGIKAGAGDKIDELKADGTLFGIAEKTADQMKSGDKLGGLKNMVKETQAFASEITTEAEFLESSHFGIAQFHGGMQQLPVNLEREIKENGVEVHTGKRVSDISTNEKKEFVVRLEDGETMNCDQIFSGIPACGLSRILMNGEGTLGAVGRGLNNIDFVPVVCVTLGWTSSSVKFEDDMENAFGHLAPSVDNKTKVIENAEVLGVIYDSNICKNRDEEMKGPEGTTQVTVMLGGAFWNEESMGSKIHVLGCDGAVDEENPLYTNCLGLARKAVGDQLGPSFGNEPDFIKVDVLDEAIPQYYVGHKELVEGLNGIINSDPLLEDRFHIGGNSYYGVGIPHTILSSRYIAENAAKFIREETN